MLRRLLSIVLAFSLVFGITILPLEASQSKISVKLNGRDLELEEEVYSNEEGMIMLPLRKIFEELNYEVKWDGGEKSIKVSNEFEDIKLKIEDSNIVLKGDKSFMPLELLNNNTHLIVGVDNNQQTIKINQAKESSEEFFAISEDKVIKDRLNEYMEALEKNQNFYGAVLVAKDGEVLLNEGYGFSDLNQKTKNKSGTKFAIGSVTKQFTAMGIMQLVEKDLINVEDKVSKYIPSAPHGDEITIHNLLTHTSGLVNYTSLNEFLAGNIKDKNPMELIEFIKDLPLGFEPGERFEYNNTGYLLLGMIIENVSEKSFEDYIQENIFNPLNMKDTGMSYGKNNEIFDSTPYVGHLEVQPIDEKLLLSQAYGAGNIYSTVEDLYRWDRALNTGKLVKKESLDEMLKEHTPMSEEISYGYGWMIADVENGREIYHGGNTFGHSSNIARYIDKDLTVIILTNKGVFDVEKLTNTLTKIALDKEYEMPEKVEEVEIEDLDSYDKYVGKYDFMSGTYIDIIKKDDGLYAQVIGQPAFKLYQQKDHKFFAKEADITIEFKEDDNGEINEFVFNQLGLEKISKRVKEVEEIKLDDFKYYEYVGEYELGPGLVVTITKRDNKIYAQLTGQDEFEIFPKSENEFFYKVVDAQITFVKEDDKVTSLVLHQNGQDIPAIKIK